MQADLALIAGYMQRGETAKALAVAQGLVKKEPGQSGRVPGSRLGAAARKELPAARAAYQKALELNPTYLPAVAGLARIDLAEGKPADARARFETAVARDPKNELALLALADVLATTKAPSEDIAAVLQRAIAVKPESVAARVALVNLICTTRTRGRR